MINKKVDDALFDTVLEHAFTEAFERDMEKIEAENKDLSEYPKKYVDIERAYYRKKYGGKSSGMQVFKRIAACILVVLSVGVVTIFAVPDVRASVWDAAVSWFEKYVSFSFSSNEEPIQIGKYNIGYIPKEFELINIKNNDYQNIREFSNGTEYFIITLFVIEETKINYDYENGDYSKITINGVDAHAISYAENDNIIIWQINNHTLSIEGNINIQILKRIAENIS